MPSYSSATSRCALITGAGSGIGLATAQLLVAQGWRVWGTVRRPADAQALQAVGATPLQADLRESAQRIALAAAVADAVGNAGLALLVNNAGIGNNKAIAEVTETELHDVLEVNSVAPWHLSTLLLPQLLVARGCVVHVGSIAGRYVWPTTGAYSMSKYALRALADAQRLELAPLGVRICLVEPGAIATPIWQKELAYAGDYSASPFARLYAGAGRMAAQLAARGAPPLLVARAIARAATSSRPPAHLLLGPATRTRVLLGMLPQRWQDALIRRLNNWG